MPSPTPVIPASKPKLDPVLAAALDVPRSARDRQVADAVMRLVPDDEDRERAPKAVAGWLRHIIDLVAEREWMTEPIQSAQLVADDAISDIFIDDVEDALATIAPVQRATGRAATTALRRVLPPFCETLVLALVAAAGRQDGAESGDAHPFAVPVVDISGWFAGDEPTRSSIAAAIDAACRRVGFIQIVGHGIPAAVVDGLTAAMDRFFELPMAVKQQSSPPRPSVNRGYTAPKAERLSYSLGVASPADLFEAFNVGSAASEFPDLDLDPETYAENIWPNDLSDFEPQVRTWFRHAGALARTMTSIFATALGIGHDHFAAFTDHSIDVLRVNNYRVPDDDLLEPDQLGMGAHTDYGIVTVLWADPVPGLQILRPDGIWHSVMPLPGAMLINLGDLLSRWTNDRWLSTMHRVVPPTDTDGRLTRRRSAAYFHDGNADAVISTLAPCLDGDGTSSYDDVTVGEHLAQKLGGSRGLALNEHAAREAARIESSQH